MKRRTWNQSIILLLALAVAGTALAGMSGNSDKDMAITQKVQEKFQGDNHLMNSNIRIETINGEVTLKGVVATEHDVNRAAKLASYVEGVHHVDNRLTTEKGEHYKAKAPTQGCQIGANWEC